MRTDGLGTALKLNIYPLLISSSIDSLRSKCSTRNHQGSIFLLKFDFFPPPPKFFLLNSLLHSKFQVCDEGKISFFPSPPFLSLLFLISLTSLPCFLIFYPPPPEEGAKVRLYSTVNHKKTTSNIPHIISLKSKRLSVLFYSG